MKPSAPSSSQESRDHLFKLLQTFDTAMLVTRTKDDCMHGRPLSIADKEENGTFWFMVSSQSNKVAEIRADSRVLVVMQSSNQFIEVRGHAEIVTERAKVEELWSDLQKVWFKGKDDPDILLLRFVPEEAEFWDNAGALGIKFAFNAVKAIIRNDPLTDRGDPKAHGKVSL